MCSVKLEAHCVTFRGIFWHDNIIRQKNIFSSKKSLKIIDAVFLKKVPLYCCCGFVIFLTSAHLIQCEISWNIKNKMCVSDGSQDAFLPSEATELHTRLLRSFFYLFFLKHCLCEF